MGGHSCGLVSTASALVHAADTVAIQTLAGSRTTQTIVVKAEWPTHIIRSLLLLQFVDGRLPLLQVLVDSALLLALQLHGIVVSRITARMMVWRTSRVLDALRWSAIAVSC